MIVDGVFNIKGRGWVLLGDPYQKLNIGQKILQLDGKCIGTIRGLEYTVRNWTKDPVVGVVMRRRIDKSPLPSVGDIVTFE
jgi:hypothetical protein